MIEDQKRQKQKKHQRLVQKMKKQIITDEVQNIVVSYSQLPKKSGSGAFKNNRIFFLIHKDKIGYLNELPKGVLLPFQNLKQLPSKLKAQVKLADVIQIKAEKDSVIAIDFKQGDKKQKWLFIAASPQMAKNWEKMVAGSIKEMKQDLINPPRDITVDPVKKQDGKQQDGAQNVQNKNQSDSKLQSQQQQSNKSPLQQSNSKKQLQQQQGSKLQQNSNNPYANNDGLNRSNDPQNRQPQQGQNQNNVPSFGSKIIQKPKSTLFVGGIAVQNQKDQTQLKNKLESFQSLTSKMKQQYDKKRRQQKRIQEQIIQQSSSSQIAKNILNFSTNTKYQIEKMQRQWGYEFVKSENQYEIIEKFKEFVEAVTRKIVDQLGLEQKKRYYQPQQSSNSRIKYEINGVLFQVFLTELKQTGSTYGEKGTIASNAEQKMAAHEFKNYDYILKITKNKGKLRVPLSMITHYKGFSIYVKVLIPSAQTYQNMQLLQKQLTILQAESRINNSIFVDPDTQTGRIVALQSKAYQKLARAQNSSKKFDICYIEDLLHYLPHDFTAFSKDKPYHRLRPQLVQQSIQQNNNQQTLLHGQNMCQISTRLKLPQELRDGITELTQLSKNIQKKIIQIVQNLQNLQENFNNSQELAQILHRYGVNMRYLGAVMQRCRGNWLKQVLVAEIVARCAKKQLYFDLQNCVLNLFETNIQNVHRFQLNQLIKFLNKLLGNSQQSQMFWKSINKHAQYEYKISINKQQINEQFLMQALQFHCGFKFKQNLPLIVNGNNNNNINNNNNNNFNSNNSNSRIKDKQRQNNKGDDDRSVNINGSGLLNSGAFGGLAGLGKKISKIGLSGLNASSINMNSDGNQTMQLFASPTPFSVDSIACFQQKSKTYNLSFTQFHTSIQTLISSPQILQQSTQQLKTLLNLSRIHTLPSHIKLSPTLHTNLSIHLSYFLSPKQMPFLYHLQQSQIVLGDQKPSKLLYGMKMAEIKWMIKQGRVQESQGVKDWVIEHVGKWVAHQGWPILTELYQIYANYYMTNKEQEKKAVNYCKSAIKNQQKLLGLYHPKMADSYYLLGTVYLTYLKKAQALNSFKKASQIILKSNIKNSQPYGLVCLKMSQLYLSLNELQTCIENGLQAISILDKFQNKQALMEAIQVVARCYQVGEQWELYMRFIQEIGIEHVGEFKEDVQMLERIVKVCILPSFRRIAQTNTTISQKILKMLSQLPQTTRSPNMAYNFLLLRISQNTFPQRFLIALNDIEQILQQIQTNGMLARWKGFQNLSNKSLLNKVGVGLENPGFSFIATLEAVNLFLGASFIEGLLLEQ